MGFFSDLSKSPRERRQSAKLRNSERLWQAEIQPNQNILPGVKLLAMASLEASVATQRNWQETIDNLKNYREVSLKANAAEELANACESHALACHQGILFRLSQGYKNVNFENLKFTWWQVFEDLRFIYLSGKMFNVQPNRIQKIIDVLIYLDSLIHQSDYTRDEWLDWQTTRNSVTREFPSLPTI